MTMDDMRQDRTHASLGNRNRRAVMEEIVLRGPLSRTEIAANVGLTTASISRITSPLIDEGLIREVPMPDREPGTRPGRPSAYLDIAPEGGQVLGVGIGRTFQTITLTNLKNQVISGTDLKLDSLDDPDMVVERVADGCRRLIDRHIKDRERLLGGFLMIPASVDGTRGNVLYSNHLGWRDVPLRSKLVGLLDLPMRIESMMTAFTLAETRFGAARGQDNVLVLVCALGLGAGLVLDGRFVKGKDFAAEEIGRMMVAGKDGNPTTLDRVASGHGILQNLHGDDLSDMSLREQSDAILVAIERDRDGDSAMGALMADAGRALGQTVAQFVHFIAPESVVVAGPLGVSPSYVSAVRDAIVKGLGTKEVNVVTSAVTGPVSGQSATCGLAICEYLFEKP